MVDKNRIFADISRELQALFELREDQIAMDSRLYEDLDLDSIDAVDLVVRLQDITKTRIKPEQFKSVTTVGDIVTAVEQLLSE